MMIRPRFLKLAALLFAPLSAAAAQAQGPAGQTPANAQGFITKVVQAGGVKIEGRSRSEYFSRGVTAEGYTVNFAPPSLTSMIVADNVCKSSLKGSAQTGDNVRVSGTTSAALNPIWETLDLDLKPIWASVPARYFSLPPWRDFNAYLEWGNVLSVKPLDNLVIVALRNRRSLRFTFGTNDIATRVGFAMEVLRMGCDPTADENF